MSSIVIRKRRLQGFQGNDETYTGLDLGDMSAWASRWVNCVFEKCDLTLADFGGGTYFEKCEFRNCDLTGASFRAAQIRECSFTGSSLRRVAFVGCSPITHSRFVGCNLRQSSFFEATVFETGFLDCNLHGSDIRFIESVGVDFTGSNLWGTSFYMGCSVFNSTFDERTVNIFIAMAARVHPNPETKKILQRLSGKMYGVACRLMDSREKINETLEQPAIEDQNSGDSERVLVLDAGS